MIRPCTPQDFDQIHAIINDGAEAYKGIIPADRFPDPYMSRDHLQHEIDSGVIFHGYENPQDPATLAGVMGVQHVRDVTLIRHAYVRATHQKQGIGTLLLAHLRELTDRPVLIGTWADADWAIRFYHRHGFRTVSPEEKNRLLKRYWTIPDRQVETSVVLADSVWLSKDRRNPMNELTQALIAESYAAAPSHILEGLTDDLVHRELPNVPHTIYAELWHLTFWQQITLDWIAGIETPYPDKPSDGFSSKPHTESWVQLRHRFLHGADQAAAAAEDTTRLDHPIRCPSRRGAPTRIMSVNDQLISLAAHNAYHLGRIVLLRQLLQAWPPTSGGFTW